MMRAPLVEDDASFALLVRSILEREGFAVDLATTGSDALTMADLVSGTEVPLTAKEFPLLEHLLLRVGEVVSRTELLERVWDMHFDPGSNIVDVNVCAEPEEADRCRRRLNDSGSPGRRVRADGGNGATVDRLTA